MAVRKKITFIIPVYNVEEYLDECVDSILSQITDDCEVVLIDDGATDQSGTICDGYAIRDARVKVVHQANGGLAMARNTGLKQAEGEYIAFVDADDYIAEGCILQILKWIESGGADICFMKANKVFPNGKMCLLDKEINADKLRDEKEHIIKYLSELSKFPGSPCTKLFRKEMIDRLELRFPEDRRVSEDLGFVLRCIIEAQTYDSLMIDYYYYRQAREGSITNEVTYKSFLGLKAFVEESVALLCYDKKACGNIERYAMSFVAYEYSIMIWQYKRIARKYRKEAMEFLREFRWVLGYGMSKKIRLIYIVSEIIGLLICANILDFYMRYRR